MSARAEENHVQQSNIIVQVDIRAMYTNAKYLLLLLLFPVVLCAIEKKDSNVEPKVLSTACSEGFSDFKNWSFGQGKYRKESGWLVVKSVRANPRAISEKTPVGNCSFKATLRSNNDFHWAGLLAKGVYQLVVSNQFGRLELKRKVDGKWKTVAQSNSYRLFVRDRNLFELKISFLGNKVYAFLDDKLLIEYEDSLSVGSGGEYGLLSGWRSDIAWGNVSLRNSIAHKPLLKETLKNITTDGIVEVTWARGLREDNIYFDDELGGIAFKFRTKQKNLASITLVLVLVDVKENQVDRKVIYRTPSAGEDDEVTVKFTAPGRGCFKIALYAGRSTNDLVWIEDIGSFTVVPSLQYLAVTPESYFGGHIDGINADWHLRAAKKLGVAWLRSHDGLQTGWWTRVQPENPDQWQWPYDGIQRLINDRQFSTLGGVLWTPKWASNASPGKYKEETAPPKNWSDFERFVNKLSEHYRQSIKHWEIWNEPHYKGYWRGSPEDYVQLLEKAYSTIHNVDDNFTIIGGGGVPARKIDWIERMLQAGGAKYMDSFSIHYLDPNTATIDMSRLQGLLNEYGFSGPIWNTEESVPSTSFFDQARVRYMDSEARYHFRNACFELVRIYMENISNGVERVFYYQQMDPWRFQEYAKPRITGKKVSGGMWDEGRMLKPIGAAHAALVFALHDRRFVTRIDSDELRVFIFEGPDGATAVQYAEYSSYMAEGGISLKLPINENSSNYKMVDFMGNETEPKLLDGRLNLSIGREPRYLIKSGPDAGQALKKLYTNAFLEQTNTSIH